ncbi:MAG TPA: TonB-dependent receptor [Vicinamibacterales bacterium]|nr:TonB-dependent receptor [Vicinamibacterales bacterium]
MPKRVFQLFLTIAFALVTAPGLLAQETTGALEGVVRDAAGAVLPGVSIEVTGPVGTITTVTNDRGEYRLPRLPTGRYTVRASLASFLPGNAVVDLTVGTTARTEFVLQLAGLAETVEVTAETPRIDLTSPQTATNIARERIDLVPRGRDFTDVIAQAAGAALESQAGGVSIDGSSGSENRFIIDGIDTTSPQVGTNAVPMRAEFMEEVQVKSAGYAAEFGGSTGGVINAITRSGTNEFHGTVLADFQQRGWGGDERPILIDASTAQGFDYVNPPKDDELRIDPGFSLGGPILRNRLWFFGSYQPGFRDTERTVNFENGVTNTFDQEFRIHYGAVNVTGNAGSKVLYRAGANFSPYEERRSLPTKTGQTSLTDPDDWLRGSKGDRRTYSGSVDYVPSPRVTMSARAGRFLVDEESTGVTFPGIIHNISTSSTAAGLALIPAGLPNTRGYSSDVLITDATARDEYIRDYFGADATWFANAGGEHQIKGGIQTERIANDVLAGYNADRILYYAGLSYTTTGGVTRAGQYGIFRLLNISTQGDVATRNTALFIQDTWRVRPNLTVTAGLRTEHEKIPNFGTSGVKNPIEFNFGEKLAPRVGFTYDPFSDGRTKIYSSWGKYYDVMKYELPRGSFGGDKWVDYWYTWDNPDVGVNTAAGCGTGTNTISERPTCPGGGFIEAFDQRHNAAEDPDSFIDPDLKPMEENEFQLGVSRDFNWGNQIGSIVLGARYIRKDLVRTIEDVGVTVPGVGTQYYMANPGEGISLTLANAPGIPPFPKAERQYDGLELTADRRFANNWGLFASYTYSRLYGNYSGLASSDENGRTSPNVNRFFDQIVMTFDKNQQLVYGLLGTDRPHRVRAHFLYRFPFNLTAGLSQRVESGIPMSEEFQIQGGYPFFPNGRGNLGRTPVLSTTDLSLLQDFRLGGQSVQFQLTVLNLFDQDTVTRLDNTRFQGTSTLPITTSQFFNTQWDYEGLLAANPSLVDPKYARANQYLAPREVRLTLKFVF